MVGADGTGGSGGSVEAGEDLLEMAQEASVLKLVNEIILEAVNVRASVIPMLFGEGVVMRLLDRSNVLFTLPELGIDDAMFTAFKGLIDRPHGIILVTGPTGAGKTTTLYAALNAIVGPGIKVLTVEDPVEYHLEGVNQIPVNHQVGMTFERGLRAILRHDPDVVMIGEIRDLETARAATQAALTGHLVRSTLHTNDAASAPMRLVEMGVEPFLVSRTLVGSMAQRLVRRICPKCKIAYEPLRVRWGERFGVRVQAITQSIEQAPHRLGTDGNVHLPQLSADLRQALAGP